MTSIVNLAMTTRSNSETALPGTGNKAANAFKNRVVSLQIRSRILTRSNAVVMPKSPENPLLDIGLAFAPKGCVIIIFI